MSAALEAATVRKREAEARADNATADSYGHLIPKDVPIGALAIDEVYR